MSRHVTIDEKAIQVPLDPCDLDRKIQVDNSIMIVREATSEQFDMYIYEMLFQMYSRRQHALNRYEQSFWEHDYAELSYRLTALNKLRLLNQEHAGAPLCRPEVPLFVQEKSA